MDREARESGNLISLNDVMQQVSPEDRSDSPASVSVADELGSSSSFLEGIFGPMAPRVEGSGNLISLNDVMLKISPEARGDSSASEAEADELAFLEGILGPMPPEARKNYEETMRKLREKIVLGSRGYEEE
jgi:hypothetical protein